MVPNNEKLEIVKETKKSEVDDSVNNNVAAEICEGRVRQKKN